MHPISKKTVNFFLFLFPILGLFFIMINTFANFYFIIGEGIV